MKIHHQENNGKQVSRLVDITFKTLLNGLFSVPSPDSSLPNFSEENSTSVNLKKEKKIK